MSASFAAFADRNQLKSLLGIETHSYHDFAFQLQYRNQLKSLLGIETLATLEVILTFFHRNQLKSLLGIETWDSQGKENYGTSQSTKIPIRD